ncbi:hypothetical protein ACA910_004719 [Epithemia clementina (nom. ined.)]
MSSFDGTSSPSDLLHFIAVLNKDSATAFPKPVHQYIESDKTSWDTFMSSFDGTSSPSDLLHFIAVLNKDSATAFLGGDSSGRSLILFHNLIVTPGSGSLASPDPEFLCLSRKSFDFPPSSIDSVDITSMLTNMNLDSVPTFREIVEHCPFIPPGPSEASLSASTYPRFSFSKTNFETFSSPAGDDALEFSESFTCKIFIPIPPSVAGPLINYFDKFPVLPTHQNNLLKL